MPPRSETFRRNCRMVAPLDSMKATNAIFTEEVVKKGNYGALAHVYTKTARILPPGGDMVIGRDAIIAFWSSAIPGMGVTGGSLTTVEAMEAGDGIVEIGRAELVTGGGAVTVKYVVYWKQEDGVWKWHVDIWNPNA